MERGTGAPLSRIQAMHRLLEGVYASAKDPIGGSWSLEQLTQVAERGESLCLWAQGELVSFILYHRLMDGLDIMVLATCVNHQGRGLMEALLNHLCQNLYPHSSVWLEVHSGNGPAQMLYEKLGFRRCGVRRRYYRDGGDAILYAY